MTITQAMDKIHSRYVPGTVAYFGGQSPDRWQDAHEEWHQSVMRNLESPEVLPKLHELYCEKICQLADEYRKRGEPMKLHNPIEAFNSPDTHAYWSSVHYKICYKCEVATGLKIKVLPESTISYLVCKKCDVK